MTGAPQPPAWIRGYSGMRYVNGGRGPNAFDCYGIMAQVMNDEYQNSVPMMHGRFVDRGQGRLRFLAEVRRMMSNRSGWIEVSADPRPGDGISLLRGAHCGVVVAIRPRPATAAPAGWMLHVHEGIDVTCEEFNSDKWRNKVDGFWRFVGDGGGVGGDHA